MGEMGTGGGMWWSTLVGLPCPPFRYFFSALFCLSSEHLVESPSLIAPAVVVVVSMVIPKVSQR